MTHELVLVENAEGFDAALYGAHVAHSLDDVAGTCFTLRAHHGGTFADAPQGFAQIATTTDEGHGETVFVHMVFLVISTVIDAKEPNCSESWS